MPGGRDKCLDVMTSVLAHIAMGGLAAWLLTLLRSIGSSAWRAHGGLGHHRVGVHAALGGAR